MKTNERLDISEQEQLASSAVNNTVMERQKAQSHGLTVKKIINISIVLILVVAVLLVIAHQKNRGLTTVSKATLEKVIEINELSTVDYTYNAIAIKLDEDDNIMYYVAYEGTVTAGIDFNEIGIDIDEEEKNVTITIPEIEIHSTKVDMGTMEYIFVNDSYETEEISHEAYKLCLEDLRARIQNEKAFFKTARENAISSVEALFKPLVETVYSGYTVEYK